MPFCGQEHFRVCRLVLYNDDKLFLFKGLTLTKEYTDYFLSEE